MGLFDGLAALEGAVVLEALGSAEELDGQDMADELDCAGGLGGCARAEAVVILHACAGGDIGDAGGSGEGDELVDACRGGVLGDHQTAFEAGCCGEVGLEVAFGFEGAGDEIDAAFGDAGDMGEADGKRVEGDGQRHAVEIGTGDDGRAALIGEDERVVGDCAEFDFNFVDGAQEGPVCRAEDCGGCAKGVGVLDAGVIFEVGGADGAASEEAAEFAGDEGGAGVAAGFVETFIEKRIAGAAAVDGHRGGEE